MVTAWKVLAALVLLMAMARKCICMPPSVYGGNIIPTDYRLYSGNALSRGNFTLIMQEDCNLVLYEYQGPLEERPVWSTKTYGQGSDCSLKLEIEGRLVLLDGWDQCNWASQSVADPAQGSFYFRLIDGRGELVYDRGGDFWSTQTGKTTSECFYGLL